MTNAKHTQGPWFVTGEDEYANGIPAIEISNKEEAHPDWELIGYAACEIIDDNHVITERTRANALLIAAAPELLEALQEILAYECETKEEPETVNICYTKARAAITKATGGQ